MKWPWSRRSPPPTIPPYRVPVQEPKRAEPGIVVEEVDTSAMTQTGVHKAWKRLTGQK